MLVLKIGEGSVAILRRASVLGDGSLAELVPSRIVKYGRRGHFSHLTGRKYKGFSLKRLRWFRIAKFVGRARRVLPPSPLHVFQ